MTPAGTSTSLTSRINGMTTHTHTRKIQQGLADLIHLQEQPSKVGLETALECFWRAIWGMLDADDACIVSRSPRGLGRMMAVFVEVFGTFGLTISREQDEDHVHVHPACTGNEDNLQRHGATVPPDNLLHLFGGTVTETPNLSDEINQQIRVGWMGFKCYTRELYDRPKVSLLPLKARMVRSEIVQALLYGCATWTPLKGHYTKLRTTPQDVASNPRSLVQVAEQAHPLLQRRPPANRMREHRNNRAHEEVVVGGSAAPHG